MVPRAFENVSFAAGQSEILLAPFFIVKIPFLTSGFARDVSASDDFVLFRTSSIANDYPLFLYATRLINELFLSQSFGSKFRSIIKSFLPASHKHFSVHNT
jgi:Gpi18-like mannosyltransferase